MINKKSNQKTKRRLMTIVIATGVIANSKWAKPVLSSIALTAHAQTTDADVAPITTSMVTTTAATTTTNPNAPVTTCSPPGAPQPPGCFEEI